MVTSFLNIFFCSFNSFQSLQLQFFSASKPEETSKESASLPPILPSQETAIQDPLNVSLAAPQSLTVTSASSSATTAVASEDNKASTTAPAGEGSASELPEMFQCGIIP